MNMIGASKTLWPSVILAALPLMLIGCGGQADPNAATQFRPVDDEEPVKTDSDPVAARPAADPAVELGGKPPAGEKPAAKKPAADTPAAKGTSPRPPATKDTKPSNDPALAGSTRDKVRLLRSLLASLGGELKGNTQQEKIQYLMEQLQQGLATAEEILADEKAPAAAREEALLGRFQVASMMLQFGMNQEAKELLSQAAADLAKSENPQYATLGRVQLFKIHVMDVLQLQPADAKEVLTALDTLLEEGGDVDVITSEVVPLIMQLEQFGYAKDGVAAIAKVGDHFAASEDEKESMIGMQLQVSALVGKLRSGEGDAAEVGDEVVAKAKEIVESSKADPGSINLLYQLARGNEGDAPELAGKLYDLIEEKYSEYSDAKVADKAKELVANGRVRLELVGKPLAITGMLVGGEAFDWSEYQGKVTLVHFWMLSSEASLKDLSNVDRLHRKYRARGLKIVGVNLDAEVEKVEELFEAQKLPWPTVTGEDESQRGFNHPAAKACGVTAESLPFNVLIGKDGKVVAAGLQGPLLDETIVKLLRADDEEPKDKGEAPKDKGEDKPEEPASDPQPDGEKPDDESK